MKTKVLVFPCGSEIGLEIHNSLKYSTFVTLFGASSVSDHGKYVYKNYIGGLPDISDDNFIEKLNEIIVKFKIDFIFPAHDSVVLKLSQNRLKLKCKVLTADEKTCQISRSKKLTYTYLKDSVRVPYQYSINDKKIKYPVFLKPDIGQGSKGVKIAKNKRELSFYLSENKTLLILEYLPGIEYTIDCFTDKNGKLRFAGGRERKRITNGICVNAEPIIDKRFTQIAEQINSVLKFRGVWFFQLKEAENNELVLMEIAPRVAGTMSFTRNSGINLPLLTIFDALGNEIKILKNSYKIEIDRALINRFQSDILYKHIYLDLDDTIIIRGEINWLLIAFLYQCINKKIKLHLITKHTQNIKATLIKFKISNIFDTITKIEKNNEKSNYITEKLSIFIDDSFTEREKVYIKKGIPVFDLSEIEFLIDWRI